MCILRNICLERFNTENVYDTKIKRAKVYHLTVPCINCSFKGAVSPSAQLFCACFKIFGICRKQLGIYNNIEGMASYGKKVCIFLHTVCVKLISYVYQMHIIKIMQVEHCKCKSSCSVKRKTNGTRGCPCKGKNM